MNQYYHNRCRCVTKKRNSLTISEGRPLQYPEPDEILTKTFQIKYQNQLSLTAKLVLNSFRNKYIYYAIDDILYTFKSSPIERDNLLAIFYSPILSLQNNFCINFFDIWIGEVYLEEVSNPNKFFNSDSQSFDQVSYITYITIQFFYTISLPVEKEEPLH